MFRCFFPDEYLESAYAVNYEKLYQEGVRGLLFDIDNTLVPHGAPADKRAVELFERLRKIGFKSCFLSNNQIQRVASFNEKIGERFIENAHKPAVRNYQKAMELLGTDCSNTVFIGDQLFTDIYGAKRAGIRNILSRDLGLPFVDLEKLIVKKMNLSVREIFEKFGEPFFRALETMALKELINDSERRVISLGSGLPLQEQNQKYLKELGTVVYLKGSLETLKKRLEGSSKDPLLDGEDRDDKIKKLLKQRDPVYQKFADIQVVTGVKPFEELVHEIEEKLAAYEKNS